MEMLFAQVNQQPQVVVPTFGPLQILASIVGLVNLVMYVLVLVKMFQSGDTTMGIICIVSLCCGIGGLLAFIMGWVNADKYKIRNIMLVWTILLAVYIILAIFSFPTYMAMFNRPA